IACMIPDFRKLKLLLKKERSCLRSAEIWMTTLYVRCNCFNAHIMDRIRMVCLKMVLNKLFKTLIPKACYPGVLECFIVKEYWLLLLEISMRINYFKNLKK